MSSQLLLDHITTESGDAFPNPLPDLSIDLGLLLADPRVISRGAAGLVDQACIQSVQLANESLETVISLLTGEVVVYRLSPRQDAPQRGDAPDGELVILEDIITGPGLRYSPYFMLSPGRGSLQACALSNVGERQDQ